MLEVKNLVKDYRPKKGKAVRAVDGISIKFPEKGMVFILGKSGSGKSTLLNLLGGLDKYDSGEIIIKGKSSKDFSQSEFDSYRNTYLGFIFQEYNILSDFNVAQNIAIALQLQGQKATDEKINEILKEVDLEGYGGRKPSELSGGQKQRVAIARALVKSPEIIMADEPTGALDSKTGLQVFDTLKKLSRDKLVITITHDRDFAEMYGDRVIELKDGKIISDIEKYTASAKEYSAGLKVTDDKVISIKKGYVLTEKDVALINEFLQKNEMMISADDKTNGDLKRFARINDEGEKESFRKTDESKISYPEEKKFRLIKSRLPLKNMIVIGASGLKNKPIRLIVTILLSLVAFTMFGLTDTLAAYNKVKATEKSIEESGIAAAALTKSALTGEGEFQYKTTVKISDGEVAAFSAKTGMEFLPVLSSPFGGLSGYFLQQPKNNYYAPEFSGVVKADEDYLKKNGFAYVGKIPVAEDEIAVSKHFYEGFAEYGYHNGDVEIKAEDCKNQGTFLAKKPTISYDDLELKITAIIDTEFDDAKYESLKSDQQEISGITDFFLMQEMEMDVSYGFHGLAFVGSALWDKILFEESNRNGGSVSMYDEATWISFTTIVTQAQAAENCDIYYLGSNSSLTNDGVLIDVCSALSLIDQWNKIIHGTGDDKANELSSTVRSNAEMLKYFTHIEGEEAAAMTETWRQTCRAYIENTVVPYLNQNISAVSAGKTGYLWTGTGESREWAATVVGVIADKTPGDTVYESKVVLDTDKEEFMEKDKDKKYSYVIAAKPTKDQWKTLVKMHYEEEEEPLSYSLQNGVMFTIGMLNGIVETLSQVFLYVGIGFAVFAALMLTNFISTSIVFKRREIGILRAVGARGSDVYGIFAIESIIIALINFVLSALATGIITAIIASSFRNEYHLSINILNFGFRQVGLILGVAVVVALVASFLPTFRISRQRPVDAIKK